MSIYQFKLRRMKMIVQYINPEIVEACNPILSQIFYYTVRKIWQISLYVSYDAFAKLYITYVSSNGGKWSNISSFTA